MIYSECPEVPNIKELGIEGSTFCMGSIFGSTLSVCYYIAGCGGAAAE